MKNDPSQNWHSSHIQFAGGRNDGFAAAVAEALPGGDPSVPMGYWTEDDLPFYYGLARTFPLCDRWFSSCLGPTFPNRRFMISGTAHGLIDDLPWDIVDYPENGTILDVLTRHGIGWANYHNVRHYSVLARRVLGGRGLTAVRRLAQTGRWLPGVADRAVGNKSFTADLYPIGIAGCLRHLRRTEQFFADADAGTLPAVSIVDPDFEVYSEENPQDIARGESFAAEVINRVMNGPGLAAHDADLAVRRARRLLRPRPAAGGGAARRRARAQLHPRPAPLAAHAAQAGIRAGASPGSRPSTTGRATTPATASGCRPSSSPPTPGRTTCTARRSTTPRCSSSSRRSGTCRRSPAGTPPPRHRWAPSTWTPSPPSRGRPSCPSPRCAGARGASQPPRRRARDLKWRSVRLAQRRTARG